MRVTKITVTVLLLALMGNGFAEKLTKPCTLVSGTIVQKGRKPVFQFYNARQYSNNGYPMSHTQFYIQDGNGMTFKIVVDNLFYDYVSSAQASLNSDGGIIADFTRRFPVGSPVEACGKIYQRSNTMALHFVHPSGCEKTKFDGFLRINGADVTDNLAYCGSCACKVSYN